MNSDDSVNMRSQGTGLSTVIVTNTPGQVIAIGPKHSPVVLSQIGRSVQGYKQT